MIDQDDKLAVAISVIMGKGQSLVLENSFEISNKDKNNKEHAGTVYQGQGKIKIFSWGFFLQSEACQRFIGEEYSTMEFPFRVCTKLTANILPHGTFATIRREHTGKPTVNVSCN
jgi:hypothetical protein